MTHPLRHAARLLLLTLTTLGAHAQQPGFIDEPAMQAGLMQMLARFTTYMKADYQPCQAPNDVGEACGAFRCNSTMHSNEDGVRSNADLGMVCAFLCKYGRGAVQLPQGVSWDDLELMARHSLVYAYSTHKANRLKKTADGRYWGSTSQRDHVWESSLWAMSVAYSAFFLWPRLSAEQRGYVYNLLRAECNYELERTIPTGFRGDTKAEENGWEACVLAATLGLFPADELAPQWFNRLRAFAINSYSHPADARDSTVVDPHVDQQRVADLYLGPNLYADYTLQNHNYFHTSYQNVVIQELGEAALALKLFQTQLHGHEQWRTNALMHNCQAVMDSVLCHLALSDGELAMPNGNDWSMLLYDQLPSYSTLACFLGNADALMLENRAFQMMQARQLTTPDGSWLLRSDIGARRMGVQAHRVMMTWLMHHVLSTQDVQPSTWTAFRQRHAAARLLPRQNIVRALTDTRFTCFSWSEGLHSYTGYIAPNLPSHPSPLTPHLSNLIVPYKAHNTGNLLGWYEVQGRSTNAEPVVSGVYQLNDSAWAMNGQLLTNDRTLDHRFALYSTPGNAVIYLDRVTALADVCIEKEKGGLLAISTDEFTRTSRTLYFADDSLLTDGSTPSTWQGRFVNIDDQFGIIRPAEGTMAFGDRANNNSIMTSLLYPLYSDQPQKHLQGSVVGQRALVYYANIDRHATARMAAATVVPTAQTSGWAALIAPDPDGTSHLLLSHFSGTDSCQLQNVLCTQGAPVFSVPTTIGPQGASATFTTPVNSSVTNTIHFYVRGRHITAWHEASRPHVLHVENHAHKANRISINGTPVRLKKGGRQTIVICNKNTLLLDEM